MITYTSVSVTLVNTCGDNIVWPWYQRMYNWWYQAINACQPHFVKHWVDKCDISLCHINIWNVACTHMWSCLCIAVVVIYWWMAICLHVVHTTFLFVKLKSLTLKMWKMRYYMTFLDMQLMRYDRLVPNGSHIGFLTLWCWLWHVRGQMMIKFICLLLLLSRWKIFFSSLCVMS